MYFLLKWGYSIAMLVYQRVIAKAIVGDKSKQLHVALEKSKLLTSLGGCETPPQNSHQQEKLHVE